MSALWIGILAGATGVAALIVAFLADRRSRTAIQRIKKIEHAPRAEGPILKTRSGDQIGFADLKGDLTLLVNVPARHIDPHRVARLEAVRHRYGADVLDVVAVPVGATNGDMEETARRTGSLPLLARTEDHPLASIVLDVFDGIEVPYAKFLVDSEGRVVARFDPDTDPRGVELSRAVEEFAHN